MPTREDPRFGFNGEYCKEAGEYDKEFVKKHDGDMNANLIFVSLV